MRTYIITESVVRRDYFTRTNQCEGVIGMEYVRESFRDYDQTDESLDDSDEEVTDVSSPDLISRTCDICRAELPLHPPPDDTNPRWEGTKTGLEPDICVACQGLAVEEGL